MLAATAARGGEAVLGLVKVNQHHGAMTDALDLTPEDCLAVTDMVRAALDFAEEPVGTIWPVYEEVWPLASAEEAAAGNEIVHFSRDCVPEDHMFALVSAELVLLDETDIANVEIQSNGPKPLEVVVPRLCQGDPDVVVIEHMWVLGGKCSL
jgi:hypothetical protein